MDCPEVVLLDGRHGSVDQLRRDRKGERLRETRVNELWDRIVMDVQLVNSGSDLRVLSKAKVDRIGQVMD